MKRLALFLALALPLCAAEQPRTWTDSKGRKIEGTLVEKTQSAVSILLHSGKRTTLKIADLSPADQEYTSKAAVFPDPKLSAKLLVKKGDEKPQKGYHTVDVAIEEIHGRQYEAVIKWIGPGGSSVGVYKTDKKEVGDVGRLTFSVFYDRKLKHGLEYKGFVVGIREKGSAKWSAVAASQPLFTRFLEGDE